MSSPAAPEALLQALRVAQDAGWVGPGPLDDQLAHSLRFVEAWDASRGPAAPASAVDLGSGGGLPGLVLAVLAWPETMWLLADASAKRCAVLVDAIDQLGLSDRVQVVHARAEDLGRQRRAAFALVTARSFASPSITAECGLPLCGPGGVLLVSEPPTGSVERWPVDGLAQLGGVLEDVVHGIAVLTAPDGVPERYPRRPGIPAKRPLF